MGLQSKGGVDLQRVGTDRKGWGHFAKDICVRSKVGQKRKRTAEAALMRCQYSLPIKGIKA